MKTKQLLSFVLALAMVVALVASLSVSASAAVTYLFVGEEATRRIYAKLSDAAEEGNVKDLAVKTGAGLATGTLVKAEVDPNNANRTLVTVLPTSAGQLVITYKEYDGSAWVDGEEDLQVLPVVEIGETFVTTLIDRVYSSEPVNYNVSNITAENGTVVSAEQVGDNIVVTVKATAEGLIRVKFDSYYSGEWEHNSERAGKAVKPTATLDLTTDSKDMLQKYNLTVSDGAYTDVTMVKVSWVITDIDATRTNEMVWDTENLEWVSGDAVVSINTNGQAVFTLENYSSVKIDATVSFAAETGFNPTVAFDETTGSDGKITLDTANGNETYSDGTAPQGEITVTVTPSDGDFAEKDAAQGETYGTYTVTIAEHSCNVCEAINAYSDAFLALMGVSSFEEAFALSTDDFNTAFDNGYQDETLSEAASEAYTDLDDLNDYITAVNVAVLSDGTVEVYDEAHESSYKLFFQKRSCNDDPDVFTYILFN